jgi:hypothetical protein
MLGGCAFVAAVLLVLMGMGKWQESGSPGWLGVSIAVAVLTLANVIHALVSGGGKRQ